MSAAYQRQQAMRWELVKLVTDLREQDAADRAAACEENGWRMSDASGLYSAAIDTLTGLATGQLDADAYLEAERQAALEQPLDLGKNGLHDVAPHVDLSDPAMLPLVKHMEERRRKTMEAIVRGIEVTEFSDTTATVAQSVLAELEKLWRDDEAFS